MQFNNVSDNLLENNALHGDKPKANTEIVGQSMLGNVPKIGLGMRMTYSI